MIFGIIAVVIATEPYNLKPQNAKPYILKPSNLCYAMPWNTEAMSLV